MNGSTGLWISLAYSTNATAGEIDPRLSRSQSVAYWQFRAVTFWRRLHGEGSSTLQHTLLRIAAFHGRWADRDDDHAR